jgi:adenylate kinase family enzyme
MRQPPAILFISGASGVGKTTVLQTLKQRDVNRRYVFVHYDSIGIPTREEMIAEAGSLGNWQEITTHRWIKEISEKYQSTRVVIIEGQSNLDFISDAFRKNGVTRCATVLLDSDWDTVKDRLIIYRNQSHLVTDDMKNWLSYLRNQAQQRGIRIVDTARQSPDQIAQVIETEVIERLEETPAEDV